MKKQRKHYTPEEAGGARQQRRIVASRPREKAKTLVSGRFRVTDEVDHFRMDDNPEVL